MKAKSLNKKEAELLIKKYLDLPKIGKSVNARRLEIIGSLLNEDGKAILQEVAEQAFDDAKDPLNALATAAKDIEEKASELGFNLFIKRDSLKKANLKDRVLWIEGDNPMKDKVLKESLASIGQPISNIENRARLLRYKIVACFSNSDHAKADELFTELKKHLNLKKGVKFDFQTFNEVLPGENRKKQINKNVTSADILLLFESPSFYSDTDIIDYIIEDNKLLLDKIFCICLSSLGNDPERKIFNELELFQWKDEKGNCKNYNEIGKAKNIFVQFLANELINKIEYIESYKNRSQEIRQKNIEKWLEGLENIPDENKTYIPNKVENINLASGRANGKKGEKALHLLDEWMNHENNTTLFALLGQYGMGKTFTSKVFAKQQIQKYKQGKSLFIPIYFDLRDFDHRILERTDFDIWMIIDTILLKRKSADEQSPLTAKDIRDIWESYNTLLIFDGLDEVTAHISDLKVEAFFLREIFKLVPDYRSRVKNVNNSALKRKMLLTCRTDYFKSITDQSSFFQVQNREHINPTEDYTCAVLLPFDEEQIKEYFRQVFRDKDPNQLYTTLSEIHNLAELSQRPVLLNFLEEIIEDIEALALENSIITTATIYDRVVNKSFDRDKAKHEIPIEIKVKVLEAIAAFLWQRANRRIEFDKLSEFLSEYLANGNAAMKKLYNNREEEALYKDLRNATLLVRSDEKDFGFSHTSVQEYFLARYIIDKLEKGDFDALDLENISIETIDFVLDILSKRDSNDLDNLQTNFDLGFEKGTIICRTLLLELYVADQKRNKQFKKPENFNLSGLTIENLNLRGSSNQYIDLSGINLKNALMDNCHWEYVNLQRANLSEANIYNSHFEYIELSDANLSSANIRGKWRNIQSSNIQLDENPNFQLMEISNSQIGSLYKKISLINPHILPNESIKSKVIPGHSSNVNYCVLIDERRVMSCASDNTLIIWDVNTGKTLQRLVGHGKSVGYCSMIDERRAMSCSIDSSLIIWDINTGEALLHLKGHTSSVNHCMLIDERRVMSCSDDRSLIIWDINTGEALLHLKGHTSNVNYCMLIDDKRAMSCSNDKSLIIWDINTGKSLQHLKGHTRLVKHCIMLDKSRVISCSNDKSLIIWDISTGEALQHLKGHNSHVNYCMIIDDRRAISCSGDSKLIIWDINTGKALLHLKGHTSNVNHCIIIDDRRVMSSSSDNSLIIWDINTGKALQHLKGHNLIVSHCILIDKERVMSCSADNSMIIWDSNAGKALRHLQGHTKWVRHCIFVDERRVMSCCDDNTLIIWDTNTGKVLQHLKGHTSNVNYCMLIDDKRVISCSYDGTLIIWDISIGKALKYLQGHSLIVSYCILIDETRVMSCSYDGTLIIWDIDTGKSLQHLKGHTSHVNYCMLIDEKRAISCSADSSMMIWDTNTGELLKNLQGHKSSVNYCTILDNKRIISCSNDKSLIIWDVNTGKILQHLKGHTSNVNFCILLDKRRVLSCSHDSTIIVWDIITGKALQNLKGHKSIVNYCMIIDERRIISCSADNSLIVWDINTGKLVHHLQGHTDWVRHCILIDDKRVLSCSDDGKLIMWDLETGKDLETFAHLIDNGYSSISPNGQLLDYSSNAWEHMHWETQDEKGTKHYLHFDEVILSQ